MTSMIYMSTLCLLKYRAQLIIITAFLHASDIERAYDSVHLIWKLYVLDEFTKAILCSYRKLRFKIGNWKK